MLMIICTNVGAFITKWTIDAPIDCTICQFLKNFKVKGPLSCPKTMFPMFHAEKIWQNDMLHDLVIPKIIEVAVITRIGLRAGPFDLFPPKTQNFQHRVLSIYAFLNFTHNSASDELQQLYAVSNSLENSIKLWFDDVIITYMSNFTNFCQKYPAVRGAKFL